MKPRSARFLPAPRPTGSRTSLTARSLQGAEVVVGGERNGNFFPVTVLTESPRERRLPGRVLRAGGHKSPRWRSEDKRSNFANDTPFGLGSYVFTDDPEQARRVAENPDTGMVYL